MARKGLTTVALVKSYLGKEEGGEDGLLDMIVAGISARIEAYCAETFTPLEEARTEYYEGPGDFSELVIDHGPISELVTVTIGTSDVDSGDLRFADRTITLLSSDLPIAWGTSVITVVYWAPDADVGPPADIQLAATIQSAFEWKQTQEGSNRLGLQSKAAQAGSSDSYIAHTWLPDVLSILQPHRRLN